MAKRKAAAKRTWKTAAKREVIDTGKDKRNVRRGAKAQFKEPDDVGRSLKRDRQEKAKRKTKSGQGIGATGRELLASRTGIPEDKATMVVELVVRTSRANCRVR